MIGNLPERDMAMLEERIKRTSKGRPPAGMAEPEPLPPPREVAPPMASGLPRPGSVSNRNIPAPSGGPSSGLAALQRRYQQSQVPQKTSPVSGRDRPVSGAFTLDLEKIESGSTDGSAWVSSAMHQLVNHNLDAIFNEDPVMPPTLSSRKFPTSPEKPGISRTLITASPPTAVPLTESTEAHEALDVILAQVIKNSI